MLVLGRATGRVSCRAAPSEMGRGTCEDFSMVMLTGATFAHFCANGQPAGNVSLPEGIGEALSKSETRDPKAEGSPKIETRRIHFFRISDFLRPSGLGFRTLRGSDLHDRLH